MPYFAPYIDEKGLHVPSYNDIIENMTLQYKSIYGDDVYLENDSQDYQFLSMLALSIYDTLNTVMFVYNNSSPIGAFGASLDRLCSFNNVIRLSKSYSLALMTLTGKAGVTLSYMNVADENGNLWQLEREFTFDVEGKAKVYASCTKAGPIQASANTINIMATPNKDWYSATNEVPATLGKPIETDSELKARRKLSVSLPSITPFDALISHLKAISGVLRIRGYENDTGNTINTMPPHSVTIAIEGGDDEEVAKAIYLKKTPGTYTNGTTEIAVMSDEGVANTIRFNKPKYVQITISVTIKSLDNYATSDSERIKQNILEYIQNLSIGENVYVSNLSRPILTANADITSPSFYIKSMVANGQTEIVPISFDEVAVTDIGKITIVVE